MPSISQLPTELLELIFDCIRDKTAGPTIASQKTFASLALTSKLFLPLARSHLYYRPIPPSWTGVTWKRALSLVSSLSTPLGELVFSLLGIVNFVAKIGIREGPSTALSFQLHGYTRAFSLYYKIFSCCPRLGFIEINCDSKKDLSKLLEALKNSLPTLKTVKFANPTYLSACYITDGVIDEALKRLRHAHIDEIILTNVDVSELSGDPRGPLALRSFSVQCSRTSFSNFRPLLPRASSSLSSISVETMLSDFDLTWILNYLPVTIRQLALNATDKSVSGYLRDYQRPMHPSLPPPNFARFTSLSHISLTNFCGPSLALLDTLSSSSPNTSVIGFKNSYWVNPSASASTSFPIVNDSIPSLLDPDALLPTLIKFKKLKQVHLGYLPTRKRDTFRVLREELEEERGIEVEWQVCT